MHFLSENAERKKLFKKYTFPYALIYILTKKIIYINPPTTCQFQVDEIN